MDFDSFRWIGESPPRVEDERLMRGAGRYIDDINPIVGCQVAAILSSPYAHGTIRHINVQPALQVRRCDGTSAQRAYATITHYCAC